MTDSFLLQCIDIPHVKQRYDTVGDYTVGPTGMYFFRVSRLGDWRKEAAVFLHEYVEAMLCKKAGVTIQQIDDWDLSHPDAEEPGALLECPYGRQHRIAESLERFFVRELGLTWEEYEEAVNAAGESRPERSDGEGGGLRTAGAGLPVDADRGLSPEEVAAGTRGVDREAEEGGPVRVQGSLQAPT